MCVTAKSRNLLISVHKTNPAFLFDGFCNWKKALDAFREHEKSECHTTALLNLVTVTQSCADVSELLSDVFILKRKQNRKMFVLLLENIQYLGRQGQPFQGNEDEESNYNQLIHLCAKDHPELLTWSKKKKDQYTCHDSQNAIIKLMSHNILREVGDNIKKAKWFSILADECRDIANKEQLTICLRWVDDDLEPHENFIVFYEIPNINADTIFSTIQDCLIRIVEDSVTMGLGR